MHVSLSLLSSSLTDVYYRCYEEDEEVAAFLLDISVRLKEFPPSFSIDEGSSTDPEKNLKCEVFTVSSHYFPLAHFKSNHSRLIKRLSSNGSQDLRTPKTTVKTVKKKSVLRYVPLFSSFCP